MDFKLKTNPNPNDYGKKAQIVDLGNRSSVVYVPKFLSYDVSWEFFSYLDNHIPWTRPTIHVFGRSCMQWQLKSNVVGRELRKEARKIEGDLDVKLSSYAKLGARFNPGGLLVFLLFIVIFWNILGRHRPGQADHGSLWKLKFNHCLRNCWTDRMSRCTASSAPTTSVTQKLARHRDILHEFTQGNAQRPEVRIVSWNNDELATDSLPVHGFEHYKAMDYSLAHAPFSGSSYAGGQWAAGEEPIYYIVSPKDVVIAKPRDAEDHIIWLLQHGCHEKALAAVEAGQGRSELLDEVTFFF
ncbi:hypothetical protein F3Y22_tig00006570pilonHSYRG00033 [Hibiscus syriacus]|uniref:Vps41 beta-propeller domain-containing protein n=1 Tax=Hibiscus syriacus TaxID=106335 RepID=A0A6A3CBG2_HIBSY|nr:hypothetical protein F3Y22_tig00006570pilonHSYRG00033 [Hibiscus syriacus]